MMAMPELILERAAWRARVLPQAGGLIASLTCAGVPILRTMPPGAISPLDAACFPMVPWCNRTAGARFVWEGRAIALLPNFAPEPHAIHGHGWQSAWHVAEQAPDICTLAYHHEAGVAGWPWAYAAQQRVALSPEGCTITLTLTNHSDTPMPAGLGLHPYLRRRAESRVRFAADGIVAVGADMIPIGEHLPPAQFGDFGASDGAGLPAGLIDHCYTGWDSTAVISDHCGTITLTARGALHLHLYAPEQQDILCLEPVSHLPDSLNRNSVGMRLLGPGAQMTLELSISASLA
jgi:aldose 1-epimerase